MALVVVEDANQEQHHLPLAGFGGLGVPVQAVAVVGSPAFPNSIKWSQDNLLAIASGHLVTILVCKQPSIFSLVLYYRGFPGRIRCVDSLESACCCFFEGVE
jgi:hypothetical protein